MLLKLKYSRFFSLGHFLWKVTLGWKVTLRMESNPKDGKHCFNQDVCSGIFQNRGDFEAA